MEFKYYVLNYNVNKGKTEMFNIFNNINVSKRTEKEVKKYLRSPSKYEYVGFNEEKTLYGFDALCKEIQMIIMCDEWCRREYEISVGDLYVKNIDELDKWDCYEQCVPNIPMICREVIHQYKQQKGNKNG